MVEFAALGFCWTVGGVVAVTFIITLALGIREIFS